MNSLYSILLYGIFISFVASLASIQSHAEEASSAVEADQSCGPSYITQVATTGDGHFVALTERLCSPILSESSLSPKNRIESVQLVVFDSDGKREKNWDVTSLFFGSGRSPKDQLEPLSPQIKIFSGAGADQFFIVSNGGTRIYTANTQGILQSFYLDNPPNNEFFTLFSNNMMCYSAHYQIEELKSFRFPDSQVWLVGKGFAVGNDCLNTKTNKRMKEWREAVILSSSLMSSSEKKGDDVKVALSEAPSSFSQVFVLYPNYDDESARVFGGLGINWPTSVGPTNPRPSFQTLVDNGFSGILVVPADSSSYSNRLEMVNRKCGEGGSTRESWSWCGQEKNYQADPNSLRQFFPLSITVKESVSYKLIKSSDTIGYLFGPYFYPPRSMEFVHRHGLASEGQWITASLGLKMKPNISQALSDQDYQVDARIFLPDYPLRKNRWNLPILKHLLTATSRYSKDFDVDIFEDPAAVFVLLKYTDGPSDDFAPLNLELNINVAANSKDAGEISENANEESDDKDQKASPPVFEKVTSDFNLVRFIKTEQGLEVDRGFSTQLSQSLEGAMSRITAAAIGNNGVLFLAGIFADGKKSVRLVKTK